MTTISKNTIRRVLPSASTPITVDLLKQLFKQAKTQKKTTSSRIAGTASTVQKKTAPPALTINDTFKSKGSFGLGRGYEIRWKQTSFKRGVKYPAKSKAIAFEIYKDGKLQKGWTAMGPAYLDSLGHARVPVRSPRGSITPSNPRKAFIAAGSIRF